jgi:hypothetical protein
MPKVLNPRGLRRAECRREQYLLQVAALRRTRTLTAATSQGDYWLHRFEGTELQPQGHSDGRWLVPVQSKAGATATSGFNKPVQ